MNTNRVATVALMQFRDLRRRPVALALLMALPLAFYFSEEAADDEFVSPLAAGGTGVAWAVAAAALFVVIGSRRADPRLVLSGFRPGELMLGRLLMLEVVGLALAAAFGVVIWSVSQPPDPGALMLGVLAAALVAVTIGLTVAAVLPRELEGTLVLIGVVGIQLSLPSTIVVSQFLPLWGPTQLMAIANGTDSSMVWPLLHAALYAVALLVVAVLAWERRVKIWVHPQSTGVCS